LPDGFSTPIYVGTINSPISDSAGKINSQLLWGLYPTDTKQATDSLGRARQHVCGLQHMLACAAVKLSKHQGNDKLKFATALKPTPTPPTPKDPEGGSNVAKSLRKALKLIERAESTTQNCEMS
jgi:hypothetical protein